MAEMNMIAPELYALDLDVAIYRTDLAFGNMVRIAVDGGLASYEAITDAREELEATGGSFDLLGHLKKQGVADDEIAELQTVFGDNEEGIDYLHSDAHPVFAALDATATPAYIHTKGGFATQVAKLRSCSKYDFPHIITELTRKFDDINAARTPEGTYAMQTRVGQAGARLLVARSVFLVEDKPVGFEGMGDDCNGFLVVRSRKVKPSQRGEVPARVGKGPNLQAVTDRIYAQAEARAAAV